MVGYPLTVLADAPTAYWRFGEASGLSAADATGNGHTMTLPASHLTYGVAGAVNDGTTGFALDGSQAQATFTAFAIGTTCTIEFWIRPDSTTSPSPYALLIGNGGGGVGLYYDKSTQKMLLYTGANERNGTVLTDGALYHVVISINAGNGTWYINGVADGTFSSWPGNNFGSAFNGNAGGATIKASLIDEIALYPTALSAAQVLAHYNAGQPFNTAFADDCLDYIGPSVTVGAAQ